MARKQWGCEQGIGEFGRNDGSGEERQGQREEGGLSDGEVRDEVHAQGGSSDGIAKARSTIRGKIGASGRIRQGDRIWPGNEK